MLLLNVPVPVPSLVFEVSAMVGVGEVLQMTPRAVTAEPPWELTFPPLVAAVVLMLLAAVVLTVAVVYPTVVKDSSSP